MNIVSVSYTPSECLPVSFACIINVEKKTAYLCELFSFSVNSADGLQIETVGIWHTDTFIIRL